MDFGVSPSVRPSRSDEEINRYSLYLSSFCRGDAFKKEKCSDSVIAAGILHDTLEDTDTNYETLVENFGEHIANLVRAASEPDKAHPWHERKQHTIEMLKELSIEEIQEIWCLTPSGVKRYFNGGQAPFSQKKL